VSESLTGGRLAARLAETPGSADVFAGGVVAYQSWVKRDLLDVPPGPVVTAGCAEAMADGVARLLGVEVALAVTGVAGPAPLEGQPVGLVFGACWITGATHVRRWRFIPRSPDDVRRETVDAAVDLLVRCVTAEARSPTVVRPAVMLPMP
jgi:PncC family amidohydrolase